MLRPGLDQNSGAESVPLDTYWVHGGKTEAEVAIHLPDLDAVLLGDGDSLFAGARAAFDRLLATLSPR